MRRWAIRIANAALFALCCWLLAGIARDLLGEVLMPANAEVRPPSAAVASARGRSWNEREPILTRNLFGARLAGPAVAVVEEPEEELEETKLPLKLLGTIAGESELVSNAAIFDESVRKHQVVFVGDRLQNHERVQVVRIERGRVILQNGAKREELRLDEDAAGLKTASVARTTPPRRNPRSRNTAARARRNQPKLAERLDEVQRSAGPGRSPANLFSQARIVPKYEDGAMVGIQLNEIEDGSLYEKIGLSDGDVITSLNDIKIDSASASAKILSEFTEADSFSVELQRGDTIQIGPDQLEALLAD